MVTIEAEFSAIFCGGATEWVGKMSRAVCSLVPRQPILDVNFDFEIY